MSNAEYLFPEAPVRFGESDFNRLLVHATRIGASDVKISTNRHIIAKVHGRVHQLVPRLMSPQEVDGILAAIYGPNGPMVIKGGQDVDFGYDLSPSRSERYRFRVNAVGGLVDGSAGTDITIRTVKIEPPTLADLKLDEGITHGIFPQDGIVLVAGPTGSGKSTLLSGVMRHMLEDDDGHRFIVTFEAPIEYVYDSVRKPNSTIWQTEIGPSSNLPTFADGIRNAMRRAPDVIYVGEIRDIETVDAALAAAQSGHAVYGTIHANSVADTTRRFVNFFPPQARSGVMNNLISSLRMVVWQRLYRRADGPGRIAVREYLHFDDETRAELLKAGAENIDQMVVGLRAMVRERGRSAGDSAREFFEAGQMSEVDFLGVARLDT